MNKAERQKFYHQACLDYPQYNQWREGIRKLCENIERLQDMLREIAETMSHKKAVQIARIALEQEK